jgi:hypothetical protein
MTNTVTVRAHERKKPAKKPDPFQSTIEARRAVLAARWKPSLGKAEADKRVNEFRDEIGFVSWVRRMLGRK